MALAAALKLALSAALAAIVLVIGCSFQSTDELKALAVESIERVDSLAELSYQSANVEMQRFTGFIHQLRKRDSKTDWVQAVLGEARVYPEVINPLRYNIDPARQYAMLAKAETSLFHLTALWNLARVPLWETDRTNHYLMEGMLAAGKPDLAIEVLAMIPPDQQRSAAIDAISLWYTQHTGDTAAVRPTESAIALLVELTLEIRPLSQRTLAILNTGALLEDLGYDAEAEALANKGLNVSVDDQGNPFVASAAFNNIGRAIGTEKNPQLVQPDPQDHPAWNRLSEANEMLRTCQSDSQRVSLLIELATGNIETGNRELGLQQLDVAQMFLQLLDSERQGDFIKEKLLLAARTYARAGYLNSALRVLSDRRLELSDTWVSLTLTDISVELAQRESPLDGESRLALHQFIQDQILQFGI